MPPCGWPSPVCEGADRPVPSLKRPGRSGSRVLLDGASSVHQEGGVFEPWSGHAARLWVQSPVGWDTHRRQLSMFLTSMFLTRSSYNPYFPVCSGLGSTLPPPVPIPGPGAPSRRAASSEAAMAPHPPPRSPDSGAGPSTCSGNAATPVTRQHLPDTLFLARAAGLVPAGQESFSELTHAPPAGPGPRRGCRCLPVGRK